MPSESGFRVVGTRVLSEHMFIRVEELEVEGRGERFNRLRVYHPGAVAIVAVRDGSVHLIRQYRAAADQDLLEIPAGTLDVPGEDPAAAARRELAEEIGMRPEQLDHVFDFYTAPGFTNELMRLFHATGLVPVEASPDGPEEGAAEMVEVPLDEIDDLIHSGRIADAKTLVGLQWLAAQRH